MQWAFRLGSVFKTSAILAIKKCTLLSFHNEMDFKKRIFRTSTPPNCIFLEEGGHCAIIANYMQTSLN